MSHAGSNCKDSIRLTRWVSNWALVLAVAMFTFAGSSWAQVTTAKFYGIVADPTGALIPGAAITLAEERTGVSRSATADASGEFVFDFLRVGVYTLRIEAQGFKRYQSRGMEFAAAQNVRQTFVLDLGTVTETVEVAGVTTAVNTVSTEQREGVSAQQVSELPLSRRNYTGLLTMATGVTIDLGSQPGHGDRDGGLRLNGLGRSGATFTVDGTDANANNEGRSGNMFTNLNYIDIISIEAIQEVQTVKGVIAAEYGQALSGNVNIITKSGTNEYHASAFENFQSQRLNARNQFLPNKPPLTFNQFGGSVGGPIRKNKLFFFGAYEGYRETTSRLLSGNKPTAELRAQLIRAVPAYQLALDGMPLPNQPYAPGSNVGFFQTGKSGHSRDNHVVAKGDFQLTNASRLALTYTHGRPFRQEPSSDLHNDTIFYGFQERATASFVTGCAAWTSETRFGFNLNDLETIDQFLLEGIAEETQFGRRTPQISASFLGFSTPTGQVWRQHGPTWTLEEKYGRYVGKHALKFGANFMRVICGRIKLTAPSVQYPNMADLLANVPSMINVTFGAAPYDGHSHNWGMFAQDDWRISSKLTLNIGARYDFYSHSVVHPLDPKNPAAFNNLDGLLDNQFRFGPWRDPNNPIESDGWVNIGPRFGFAYNPDGRAKTVIRGGYGILFSPHMMGNIQQSVATKEVPFRSFLSKAEAAAARMVFPVYNDDARKVVYARSVQSNVINLFAAFDPHLQNPYSMNIYLGIQRELTPTWMLESAFVATRGVKYPMERVFNPVDRLTGLRPNPNLAEGYYEDNTQNTVYTSWQSSLRKRFSRNLAGGIHYTWGKGLSTAGGDIGGYYQGDTDLRTQDFFNPRADRGPSAGDLTHYFAFQAVYDLPLLNGSKALLRQALGGWEVSSMFVATTGGGLTIGQSSSLQVTRPDYIGGNAILSDSRETLQYLNKAAYALVPLSPVSGASIRPGNVGVNAIRGPGRVNLDLSIGKNFAIAERLKLQVRADAFNSINHTNLSGLTTSLNSPTFGRFTSTRGARVVQLNARLRF